MSDFLSRIARLSPQRLALLANELNERLESMEEDRLEPIAVIGMGCRLPGGVHDAESFWKLLSDGVDAIREVPPDRWNIDDYYDSSSDTPGKMNTRWGGFVDCPDQFDPKFFGIAPAEAISMDPQQRLLLEMAWEALEDAGIPPATLAGSPTGVFVGLCNLDYGYLALRGRRETITPYFASGLSHAVAAGRISYLLGLEGTSLAVDTSCSASLMAVHLACQSLRQKESQLALAGGVNLILTPEVTVALSQSHMMAPDGRCKAFSDLADGFVRAEGGGIVVLKRMRDAVRDGDRILAIIRGSAANQDGRSSGLTAPNGRSQEAVIAAALANADLKPDDLQYVEGHGTGTSLGDPIEVGALGDVFGERSSSAGPLRIGSIKSNLGHLESAAGIAGLMKLVLSLQHREIPASLHCRQPNHRIDWNHLPIRVAQVKEPWNPGMGRRIGGVSSFGFSGTNVHVIVEEHRDSSDAAMQNETASGQPLFFPISGRTPKALQQVAARLSDYLAQHPLTSLASIARTLNTGRSHFEHRAAFVAASREELLNELGRFLKNSPANAPDCTTSRSPQIAFLFTDHPCVQVNTGRELYEAIAPFQAAIRKCDESVKQSLGNSLTAMIYPTDETAADLPDSFRRAASFAIQFATAELWKFFGIEPGVVISQGTGEWVAACVSGALSLEDALAGAVWGGDLDDTAEQTRSVTWAVPKIPWLTASAGKPSIAPPDIIVGFPSPLQKCSACLSMTNQVTLDPLPPGADAESFGRRLGTLNRQLGDLRALLHAATELYAVGCDLNLTRIYHETPASVVSLPSYPFERERYWIEVEASLPHTEIEKESRDSQTASDWLYEVSWEPRPIQQTGDLSEGYLRLIGEVVAAEPNQALLHLAEAGPRVNRLCAGYVVEVLQNLGAERLAGRRLSLDQICHDLGINPPRRRILGRLLRILAEDGILAREGEFYRFREIKLPVDTAIEHAALQSSYPEIRIELDILKRCAAKMVAVLQGTYDPMQLVFADGSVEEAEQIYQNSPVCRYFNSAARDVMTRAIASDPGGKVRILEIGGGTGATTASLLPAIAHHDIEYTFTDISPVFLAKARGKFSDVHGMSYRLLNIERSPAEQGFTPGDYDIVLAANVLHATTNLRETLTHARELLRPGGLLMLIEGAWPDRWLDLTFGLTDGWWRFADYDLRPEHPLISVEKWNDLFHQHGMSVTRCVRYEAAGEPSQQVLLMACAGSAHSPKESTSRRWIILADKGGVGKALVPLLQEAGELHELITSADSIHDPESLLHSLRSRRPQDVLQFVFLCGADALGMHGMEQNIDLCAQLPLRWMKAICQAGDKANLWLVTPGAQSDDACSSPSAFQAMTWGLGRVFGLEHPSQYKKLIDLNPDHSPQENASLLFRELLHDDAEDQIAYRTEGRSVPRIRRSTIVDLKPSRIRLRADASYLVTGGLGAVGRRLTRWLAESGAGHIVVLSRGGLKNHPGSTRLVEEVNALGSRLSIVEGDVASSAALEKTFAMLGSECPPLRGVLHAATVQSIAEIAELSEQQLLEMLRPKVIGTCMLHEWTKSRDLDFFVVFSSTTSVLGSRGMAHYAAANQFLDRFAQARHAQNLPMMSINWGAWQQDQEWASPDSSMLEKMGLRPMDSSQALQCLSRSLNSSRPNIMIADVDWKKLKAIYEARRLRPILAGIESSPGSTQPAVAAVSILSGEAQIRETAIAESVASAAAAVLGFRKGDALSPDVPLTDLGLDSLMAVDLRNRLQTEFKRELPSTIVFDYPTISGLSAILESMLWVTQDQGIPNAKSPHDEIRI